MASGEECVCTAIYHTYSETQNWQNDNYGQTIHFILLTDLQDQLKTLSERPEKLQPNSIQSKKSLLVSHHDS